MLFILLFYYLFSCGFIGYIVNEYRYNKQMEISKFVLIIIVLILSPILFPIFLGAYCFALCDNIEFKNKDE